MVMGMANHDLITKDFALYVVHYFASMLTWSKEDILGEIDIAIKEAKPVDAVPVVRCKDCKHIRTASWGEKYCVRKQIDGTHAELSNLREDDFCSYGERKDNA